MMICYGMAVKRRGMLGGEGEEDESTDCEDGKNVSDQ